jgi:hypothetical protein
MQDLDARLALIARSSGRPARESLGLSRRTIRRHSERYCDGEDNFRMGIEAAAVVGRWPSGRARDESKGPLLSASTMVRVI